MDMGVAASKLDSSSKLGVAVHMVKWTAASWTAAVVADTADAA